MKRAMVYTALVAISLGGLISVGWAKNNQAGKQAKQFVHEAAMAGKAEVELGQLATTHAANPDVKQFGQRMVTDHTKANEQLKAIAQEKNIDVPTRVDDQHKKTAEKLAKLQGASFDRAFIQQMVEDHEKAVKLFSKEAQQGQDADLKAFAAKTLPTLQEHLTQATQLAQQQKVSTAR
jgi:putative membrane protein